MLITLDTNLTLKQWVAILKQKLYNCTHCLHTNFVIGHLTFSPLLMSKLSFEGIERLQPSVQGFVPVLCPPKKLFELRQVLLAVHTCCCQLHLFPLTFSNTRPHDPNRLFCSFGSASEYR